MTERKNHEGGNDDRESRRPTESEIFEKAREYIERGSFDKFSAVIDLSHNIPPPELSPLPFPGWTQEDYLSMVKKASYVMMYELFRLRNSNKDID